LLRRPVELSWPRAAGQSPKLSSTEAAWVPVVRHAVASVIEQWGLSPEAVEETEVLTSELVTNALRYGEGEVGVWVGLYSSGLLYVQVRDGSSHKPAPRTPGLWDESGRGLFLIAALSHQWGISTDGTTVWCTIPARVTSCASPSISAEPVQALAEALLAREPDPAPCTGH
jgi:anti-sigma regulatory factor (Ser/Thr protein kinase)